MHKNKKIFVVDDDQDIRNLLKTYLERNQFNVEVAVDGESFLERVRQTPDAWDMVVLDVMLPGEDGFEICRQLRTFSMVPVIMLTANSDEMDRIIGLELGADDYLAKPFNPRELLARIKAIMRRAEPSSRPDAPAQEKARYYCFSGFTLDTTQRLLVDAAGQPVPLSGADYALLLLLLEHAGQVLSRERIAAATRGRGSTPLDRFIDVHISRLRQRLGEDAKNPVIIKTIRGAGYVMSVPVESRHAPVSPIAQQDG